MKKNQETKSVRVEGSGRLQSALVFCGGLAIAASATACGANVEELNEEDISAMSQEVHAGIDIDSSANDDPQELEAAIKITNFWKFVPSSNSWVQIANNLCSAIVLDSDAIVSAGHCFDERSDRPAGLAPGESAKVAAQVTTWSRVHGERIQQSVDGNFVHFDAVLHPSYGRTNGHAKASADIVTLKLRGDTPAFTNGDLLSQVDAAEIWTDSTYVGMRLDIYGWGNTSRKTPSAGNLHTGRDNAKIRVDRTSTDWWRGSSTKANMCKGDSGGPALRWDGTVEAVVGMFSWADMDGLCTEKDENQHFTRLNSKIDFIEQNLGVTCSAPFSGASYVRCQ